MSGDWSGPDVARDGSIQYDDGHLKPDDNRREAWKRAATNIRYYLEVFWLRQRSSAWTLVQLAGFAAFFFGAFRLFGVGVYGMDGLGPFTLQFFTTVYVPGPWSAWSVTWELAWLWMAVGVVVVGVSTSRRF